MGGILVNNNQDQILKAINILCKLELKKQFLMGNRVGVK